MKTASSSIVITVKSTIQVNKLIWKYGKFYFILFIPITILNSVVPFITILFPKWIIDAIISKDKLSTVLLLAIAMFCLRIVCSCLLSTLNHFQSLILERILNKMRLAVTEKTMKLRYEYLESPDYLNLKEHALQYVNEKVHTTITTFPILLSTFIQFIGLIWIIQKVDILIVICMLAVILINTYIKSVEAKKTRAFRKKFSTLSRKLFAMIDVTWDYKYAKDIRIFGLKNWINTKKQKLHETFSNGLVGEFKFTSKANLLRNVLNVVQFGVFYAYLVYRYFVSHITLGEFSMYLSAINNFTSCVETVMGKYVSLNASSVDLNDYMDYMKLDESSVPLSFNTINDYTIEFINVSFKYPNSNEYVLNNISFILHKGEKLSIVGDNGAGKTTLVKLLLRLYTPTSGMIKIGGLDINSIDYPEYQRIFGVVFQDYKLFAFSVAENIAYDHIDLEKVRDAAEKIGVREKIESLPSAYNTYVSKEFSADGTELSGGEQEKIVIARALYKDSKVIILDEPTSNLSPIAEYELYKDFDKIIGEKTAIYISHRMSSCRLCDKIILLENGTISEYGSHAQLMSLNGKYSEMYNVQAKHYI